LFYSKLIFLKLNSVAPDAVSGMQDICFKSPRYIIEGDECQIMKNVT